MKIDGKKYLNQNTYDKMIIDIPHDRSIKLKGKSKIKTSSSSHKFLDDFKGFEDEIFIQDELLLALIKHYLDNTFINALCSNEHVKYYDGKYSTIRSDSRLLMLRMDKSDLSEKINEMIVKRFHYNRAKYFFNKNNKIVPIEHSSPFNSPTTSFKGGILRFYTDGNNPWTLSEKDYEFLKEVLFDRFDGEHPAHIESRKIKSEFIDDVYYRGTYLVCGDFAVSLNIYSKEWVKPIIHEYNNEYLEYKGRQLVLQGF